MLFLARTSFLPGLSRPSYLPPTKPAVIPPPQFNRVCMLQLLRQVRPGLRGRVPSQAVLVSSQVVLISSQPVMVSSPVVVLDCASPARRKIHQFSGAAPTRMPIRQWRGQTTAYHAEGEKNAHGGGVWMHAAAVFEMGRRGHMCARTRSRWITRFCLAPQGFGGKRQGREQTTACQAQGEENARGDGMSETREGGAHACTDPVHALGRRGSKRFWEMRFLF